MGARPFMDLLREHRQGLSHDELTEALQRLVEAVTEERKPGTLTLRLTIRPQGDGTVLVSDDITSKPPKRTKAGSMFFVTPENNLERQDPRQTALPLHEIPGGQAEARPLPGAAVAAALA